MKYANLLVFSKDRACQLQAFLTSFRRHVRDDLDMSVLYTASTPQFEAGYCRLISTTGSAHLIREDGAFKDALLRLIDDRKKYTVFFVDDIVFRRDHSFYCDELDWLDDGDVACISLRLSKSINYTYSTDLPSPCPIKGARKWRWFGQPGVWGYPMSLDGHVFLTSDILPSVQRIDFHGPNELEAALASSPLPKAYMACLREHPLFNIPMNRVQDTITNRCARGWTAEELNTMFLSGQVIDTRPFDNIDNNSPHFEVEFSFVPFNMISEPL